MPKAPQRSTAKSCIVATLAQEILDRQEPQSFLLGSETQFCQRFNVSRVTVRLALKELEHRGLVYRKHGVGTFAHGSSNHVHRHIGVLIKTPMTLESRLFMEILDGARKFASPLKSALILIGHSPEEWQPRLANALAGVIVVAENVNLSDLTNLKNRKLPFLIFGETPLNGPRIRVEQALGRDYFFEAGRKAAEALHHAAWSGEPVSDVIVDPIHHHDPMIFGSNLAPNS